MDDQAGDAACEAVGEFPHHGAVPPMQHVEATAEVDDGQARVGGHELQDILELARRVGVYLRGRAHLGEAEPSEFEQRIVSIDALLEQGVNVPRNPLSRGGSPGAGLAETSFGTIHDPHFTAPQVVFSSFRLPSHLRSGAGRAVLGRPRQLLFRRGEAIDGARHYPP